MAKKADAGWTSKNKMPGKIPPFKTPRCVTVVEKEKDTQLQTKRHRKDNSAWGKTMEKELAAIERRAAGITKTQLQPETEQKDSGKDTLPLPCVFIPETGQIVPDESGSDEDNIPFSEIQAMKAKKKTEIPQLATGEACVGNLI